MAQGSWVADPVTAVVTNFVPGIFLRRNRSDSCQSYDLVRSPAQKGSWILNPHFTSKKNRWKGKYGN